MSDSNARLTYRLNAARVLLARVQLGDESIPCPRGAGIGDGYCGGHLGGQRLACQACGQPLSWAALDEMVQRGIIGD